MNLPTELIQKFAKFLELEKHLEETKFNFTKELASNLTFM
jgi:hypothetical protein